MLKFKRFNMVLTLTEKRLIEQLAELEDGISQSELIRRLIWNAEIERGLWPPNRDFIQTRRTKGVSENDKKSE